MHIQNAGTQSAYRAIERLGETIRSATEEASERIGSTIRARSDQVTLSAWSITISQQTTAMFQTNSFSPTSSNLDVPFSTRQEVDDMKDLVANLKDDGKILWRRARHLQKVLDLASKALEHGRALPAARILRHVARVADKLADRGRMPGDAAAELIGKARDVVDQLRDETREASCCDVGNRAGIMLLKSEFRLTFTQATVTREATAVPAEED